MKDFYTILNSIFTEELEQGKKIAIYPLGRVGMYAKIILENRFGVKGIYIDNLINRYNQEVVSLDDFLKMDIGCTVVICVENIDKSKELAKKIFEKNPNIKVRSNLENMRLHCDGKGEYFGSIKKNCRVFNVDHYDLIRVGADSDGGYVMLNDFDEGDIAYSFGIGDDVSWDESISELGSIKVNCYDHTIKELPKDNKNLRFHRIGIAGHCDVESNLLDMRTILKNNGDQDNNNLILKMDVEGAEWEFFESVDVKTLCQFKQMTFELHNLTDEVDEKKVELLKKINKYFVPVWIHANNALGVTVSEGVCMPNLLEITYVRRGEYKVSPIQYNAPIELDKPNIPDFWEVELKEWGSLL